MRERIAVGAAKAGLGARVGLERSALLAPHQVDVTAHRPPPDGRELPGCVRSSSSRVRAIVDPSSKRTITISSSRLSGSRSNDVFKGNGDDCSITTVDPIAHALTG